MDGMRGYWDSRQLLSRHGKVFEAPKWFTEDLPKISLDGEIWMGRGTFEKLRNVLNSKDFEHNGWKDIGYYVFDIPCSSEPYEQRLKRLEALKPLPTHVHIVASIECTGSDQLNFLLDSLLERGGEGLMLREPGSMYNAGPITSSLLKVKVQFVELISRD